jgi:hypothetical protein
VTIRLVRGWAPRRVRVCARPGQACRVTKGGPDVAGEYEVAQPPPENVKLFQELLRG